MRRSDEYRWKQVVITAASCVATGSLGSAAAVIFLPPDMVLLPALLGAFGGIIFGMCTWYHSANDPL